MTLQSASHAVEREYNVKRFINVEHRPGATIVRLNGDLDAATIGTFVRVLDAASESTPRCVIVVFDDCRFLDSSALLALIHAREKLSRSLKLVDRGGGLLRRILEITGLVFAFDVRSSIGEALFAVT